MIYYLSPRWTSEYYDCSMPMTFDQYSNCGFTCLYCFSAYQRGLSGHGKEAYFSKGIKAVNPNHIRQMFTELDSSTFGEYIKQRKVMQWGGLSDPFCGFERKYSIGLELLRFFREIDYPICFSTKGIWWLDDERYTELFRGNHNWNVKVSIITLDEAKAKRIEKGVPSPKARLEAIGKIANLDCGGATLRLRPFMIGITTPDHIELIAQAGKSGATALSTEFFCLEQRSSSLRNRLKEISALAGFDYLDFYRRFSIGAGYLRLNRNIKRKYVDEMEEAARKAGMRFYVSDAHFKERCHNGNCCGLSETFNYSRGQFCQALVICRKTGRVEWLDIAQDMEHLKRAQMVNSINIGTSRRRAQFDGFSLFDYLKFLWNNPKVGQSPYKMFEGVMKPVDKDTEGNLIYALDRGRL